MNGVTKRMKPKGSTQFVHLCFRNEHPMEFRARKEGRIAKSIFLQIDPEVLTGAGVVFTGGVSNKSDVNVHSLEEAKDLIDFEVLYAKTDWRDPKIKERLKQAKKCEILAPDFIPLGLIRNLPNG